MKGRILHMRNQSRYQRHPYSIHFPVLNNKRYKICNITNTIYIFGLDETELTSVYVSYNMTIVQDTTTSKLDRLNDLLIDSFILLFLPKCMKLVVRMKKPEEFMVRKLYTELLLINL